MAKKKEPAFEEKLEKLEGIVEKVEKGELGLEDTIRQFEEGMKLIKDCRKTLDEAELRINKLIDEPDVTEPFMPEV